MKLDAYDVKITLSDPDDPETKISMTLGQVPREKVLEVKLPLAGLLEQFEETVE